MKSLIDIFTCIGFLTSVVFSLFCLSIVISYFRKVKKWKQNEKFWKDAMNNDNYEEF